MKSIFATLLILIFLGMATFGFWTMGHATHEHTSCAASLVQGSLCPDGLLNLINFHVNAFRTFSSGILGQLVLSFFVLLLFGSIYFNKPVRRLFSADRLRYAVSVERKPPNILIQLLSWLSLHEKRDPSPSF